MFSKYKKSGGPQKPTSGGAPKLETVETLPTQAKPAAPKPVASAPKPAPKPVVDAKPKVAAMPTPQDKERKRRERLMEIKVELHKQLLDNLNLSALETAPEKELRAEIQSIASEVLSEMNVVLNREERQSLNSELFDEVTGLGPLEPLLKDDTINDILVNGPKQIFVERAGKLSLTDVTFKDERHLLRIIDKIVSAVGRRVDESNPSVDARLKDGSRFNAMVPPIAVDGSLVSIRKFKKDKLAIDDLVEFGAFSEEMAAYLQAERDRLGRHGFG